MKLIALALPTIISFTLGLIVYFRPINKSVSTKILGAYLLLFSLTLFSMLAVVYSFIPKVLVDWFALFFFSLILAIPPTLYLYTCSLQEDQHPSKKSTEQLVRHYYPSLILLLINQIAFFSILIFNESEGTKLDVVIGVMDYANIISLLFVFPILCIYYIYLSIRLYLNHKKNSRDVYSYSENVDLSWLFWFITGSIIFFLSLYVIQAGLSGNINYLMSIIFSLYFLFIGYHGSRQKVVYLFEEPILSGEEEAPRMHTEEVDTEGEIESPKEKLDQEVVAKLKERLIYVMENDQPYLDNRLTIHTLARNVGSNSKYLSLIINSEFEMNFVTFVNSYRIKQAKVLLLDENHDKYTIQALGELSGFNSKSAFNNVFKKTLGLTPSQFRKQQSNQNPT